ncbi:MAG: hypothetical protein JNL92_22055 [Opitutaceae bacterium]|nr:hypothetical protein [Opitutaceae bacterium]
MAVTVALTFLSLLLLVAAYRQLMRPWFVAGFFVVGLALMAVNAGRLDLQPLTWAKVITLAVTMALFLSLPRSGPGFRHVLRHGMVGILFLNILEAIVADALGGRWVNAAVGGSLLATLESPSRVGTRDLAGRPAVTYDLPWRWIAAYTAWNFTVVCANYPLHYLDHAAVLAAPIVAAVLARDRRLYLEARGFTLSLYAVVIVVAIEVLHWPWIPSAPDPAGFYPFLSAVAAALGLWNLVQRFRPARPEARAE